MTGALPTHALSVQQPWAWLIVNGHKDIENRTWKAERRGPILIHAGKTVDGEAHQDLLAGLHPVTGEPVSEELRLAYTHAIIAAATDRASAMLGGIVGVATITGRYNEHSSPWFVGRFGYTLANARPLPFMPMVGKLSFFLAEYRDPAP